MIDYATPLPGTEESLAGDTRQLGFASVAGYPSTVAGFIDPRFAGTEVVSLLLGPATGVFSTGPGQIHASGLTYGEWLKFDGRERLLRRVEYVARCAGIDLDTFEALNVLVWLLERGVTHEDEDTISDILPEVVMVYRELVRVVNEQADLGGRSRH